MRRQTKAAVNLDSGRRPFSESQFGKREDGSYGTLKGAVDELETDIEKAALKWVKHRQHQEVYDDRRERETAELFDQ